MDEIKKWMACDQYGFHCCNDTYTRWLIIFVILFCSSNIIEFYFDFTKNLIPPGVFY